MSRIFFLMRRRPPRSTLTHSFPARRSSDLAKHYDYCVIDTAPAWDGRNLMALIASDYVAVPLDPDKTERQSLNEISQSISLANKVRGEGNETRFGIVFNRVQTRSEEPTSELQSLMRTSYPGICLKTKNS